MYTIFKTKTLSFISKELLGSKMSTTKTFPSAPPEQSIDVEERERPKKIVDESSAFIFIKTLNEMITYFEKENRLSKKKQEEVIVLFTVVKTVDTFVINARTANSVALSVIGFGLTVVPISAGVLYGIILVKYFLRKKL